MGEEQETRATVNAAGNQGIQIGPNGVQYNTYLVNADSDLGLCECGTIAVGLCQKCARPTCGAHSGIIRDSRLCSAHYQEEYYSSLEKWLDPQGTIQAQHQEHLNRVAQIYSAQTIAGQDTFIGILRFLQGHRERASGQRKARPVEGQFLEVVAEITRAAPVLAHNLTAKRIETSHTLNLRKGQRQARGERRGLVREKRWEFILEFIAHGWELSRRFTFDPDSRTSLHPIEGVILSERGQIIRYSGFVATSGTGRDYSSKRPPETYPYVEKCETLEVGQVWMPAQVYYSEYDRYFNDFHKVRELMTQMACLAAESGIASDAFESY